MTQYVYKLDPVGPRSLLNDGDQFSFVAHTTNFSGAVLEVGFCSGAYPLVAAPSIGLGSGPVAPGAIQEGGTYDVEWDAGKQVFRIVSFLPPPIYIPSELVWPTDSPGFLEAGFDINGEVGENPANVTFTTFPGGSTETRASSASSQSGVTAPFLDWRSPNLRPPTDYEVRWRIATGASFVTGENSDETIDTWYTLGLVRNYQPTFDSLAAPGTVNFVWEFRVAGDDSTIRSLTMTVDYAEGLTP